MTVGRFGGMVPLGSGGVAAPELEPDPELEPVPESSCVLPLVEAAPPPEPDWELEEDPVGDPEEELVPEELPPDEFKPDPVDPELDPVELPPSAPPVVVAPMAPLPVPIPIPSPPWLGGLPAAHAEARPSATKLTPILKARISRPSGDIRRAAPQRIRAKVQTRRHSCRATATLPRSL
jgi:hypothetical protein